jgi:hypothetical protein
MHGAGALAGEAGPVANQHHRLGSRDRPSAIGFRAGRHSHVTAAGADSAGDVVEVVIAVPRMDAPKAR